MKSKSIQQKVQRKTDDWKSSSPFFAFLCDLLLSTFQSGHSSQKDAKNRKGLTLVFPPLFSVSFVSLRFNLER